MSSSDTAITDKISTLRESHAELRSMMQDLLIRLNTARATAALPPATAAPPVLLTSSFVPPIPGPGLNSASSHASLSLRSRFPDVDVTVIAAIISHEFKAADLHKLDSSNRDKETVYTFNGATNQFEVSHEYKTPFSVIIPLQSYFDILAYHVNDAAATSSFFRYTAHLVELVAEYEWAAVYDYHAIFFNRRRAEMAAGDYTQWGKRDNDLLSEHVYAHRKSVSSGVHTHCRPLNFGV